MKAKGPSNGWELVTRRILQEELPEYDIDPHMRLANVVQGRTRFVKAMSQYEIDFSVRDKETGFVIWAIELDGPTHDTEDGRRRDGNKNRWLAEAGINLIRIRHPEEAKDIRALMGKSPKGSPQEESRSKTQYETTQHETLNERVFQSEIRNIRGNPYFEKEKKPFLAKIAVTVIGMFTIWFLSHNILTNQQKRMFEANLQPQQRALAQRQEADHLVPNGIQQPNPNLQAILEKQRQVAAIAASEKTHMERKWVDGKSAKECQNSRGFLDNKTIECMNGYYDYQIVKN